MQLSTILRTTYLISFASQGLRTQWHTFGNTDYILLSLCCNLWKSGGKNGSYLLTIALPTLSWHLYSEEKSCPWVGTRTLSHGWFVPCSTSGKISLFSLFFAFASPLLDLFVFLYFIIFWSLCLRWMEKECWMRTACRKLKYFSCNSSSFVLWAAPESENWASRCKPPETVWGAIHI